MAGPQLGGTMKLVWRQIIISLLIGGLIGSAGSLCYVRHHFWRGFPPGSKHHMTWLLNKLDRKLHLSPDQKKDVEKILEESREKLKAIRNDVHPKFEEIRKETDGEIRKLLTAEQQMKFDAMRREWEARLEQR